MAIFVLDGFTLLSKGVIGHINPSYIAETACAGAENVIFHNGCASTRPAFTSVAVINDVNFHGAGVYSLKNKDFIIVCANQHLYVVDVALKVVSDLGALFTVDDMCYMCQVDKWFLVQNGVDNPVVLKYENGEISIYGRQPPKVCLVPGTVCAFVQGRIHYVPTYVPKKIDSDSDGKPDLSNIPGQSVFISSDIVNVLNPEYVFKHTEFLDPELDGGFSLPVEKGDITGFSAVRSPIYGSGIGSLFVFSRDAVCAYSVEVPRDQWLLTSISQIIFYGVGTISPFSLVAINGDTIYIDVEGHLRTMAYTAQENKQRLVTIPISEPVKKYITKTNLEYVSSAVADNCLYFTTQGDTSDIYFNKIVRADLLSIIEGSIVFDGVWSGFKVLRVLTARDSGDNKTLMIVCYSSDKKKIHILQLDENAILDAGTERIESSIDTRAFSFGEKTLLLKRLLRVKLRVEDMRTNTDIVVYMRPYGYVNWVKIGEASLLMKSGTASQYRRNLDFSLDFNNIECDNVTKELLCDSSAFQLKIWWKGMATIARCTLVADVIGEPTTDICAIAESENAAYVEDAPIENYEVKL